jgi:GMP synthase (glutamine-hydrolysing)
MGRRQGRSGRPDREGSTAAPWRVGVEVRRALVLAHSPVPGRGERTIGTVGPALREQGYAVTVGALVPDSAAVPAAEEIDLLVLLGSAEAAYDDTVPWLAGELTYLRRVLEIGTPVLGICFGAQLLARALGGTVGRAVHPERGFVALDSDDPEVLPSGTWVEFHYDAFTLPPGATPLARSDVGVQAFTHGPHLGVQFHPEITPEVFASWRSGWGAQTDARVAAEIDLDAFTTQLGERAPAGVAACRELVARFCRRIALSPSGARPGRSARPS